VPRRSHSAVPKVPDLIASAYTCPPPLSLGPVDRLRSRRAPSPPPFTQNTVHGSSPGIRLFSSLSHFQDFTCYSLCLRIPPTDLWRTANHKLLTWFAPPSFVAACVGHFLNCPQPPRGTIFRFSQVYPWSGQSKPPSTVVHEPSHSRYLCHHGPFILPFIFFYPRVALLTEVTPRVYELRDHTGTR